MGLISVAARKGTLTRFCHFTIGIHFASIVCTVTPLLTHYIALFRSQTEEYYKCPTQFDMTVVTQSLQCL